VLDSGTSIPIQRIALHAARVTLPNANGDLVSFQASIPPELRQWWTALGGDDAAWENALSCRLNDS
jgi:23S rRNA pseudouridine955/2504/2580 synthase/23S rRNA pseudouridine1911/1915/1917 synthase